MCRPRIHDYNIHVVYKTGAARATRPVVHCKRLVQNPKKKKPKTNPKKRYRYRSRRLARLWDWKY